MDKITGVQGSTIPGVQKKSQKTEGDLFRKTLNGMLTPKDSTACQGLAPSGCLGEIQAVPRPAESSPEALLDRTVELLNGLENYAAALEAPERSLKEIDPMITGLKKDADNLLEDTAQAADAQQALKRIAAESAMAASVEYIKFKRGDYI